MGRCIKMYVPDWLITLDVSIIIALIAFLFRELWSKVMNKKNDNNTSVQLCNLHSYQIESLQREQEIIKNEFKEEIKELKYEIIHRLEKLENMIKYDKI